MKLVMNDNEDIYVKSVTDLITTEQKRRLPNGAVLVDWIYDCDEKRGIVLAENEHAVQPYVTWVFYDEQLNTTSHGNYFSNLREAQEDFYMRHAH